MSIKIESIVNRKTNFYATGVAIKWIFSVNTGEDFQQIEKSGLFDVTAKPLVGLQKFKNPRSQIETYYDIFNRMVFSDPSAGSSFSLTLNRITEVAPLEQVLNISFTFHPSFPVHAFTLNQPIFSGTAIISAEDSVIKQMIDLFNQNIYINYEYSVPRCEQCNGLMYIRGDKQTDEILNDQDFICRDCFQVANNFFDILTKELTQVTDPTEMANQRANLINFANVGKSFAIDIDDIKLQNYFDALIIQINYFSGSIDYSSALKLILRILRVSEENHFDNLTEYLNNLKNCIFPSESDTQIDEPIIQGENMSINADSADEPVAALEGMKKALQEGGVDTSSLSESPLDRLKNIQSKIKSQNTRLPPIDQNDIVNSPAAAVNLELQPPKPKITSNPSEMQSTDNIELQKTNIPNLAVPNVPPKSPIPKLEFINPDDIPLEELDAYEDFGSSFDENSDVSTPKEAQINLTSIEGNTPIHNGENKLNLVPDLPPDMMKKQTPPKPKSPPIPSFFVPESTNNTNQFQNNSDKSNLVEDGAKNRVVKSVEDAKSLIAEAPKNFGFLSPNIAPKTEIKANPFAPKSPSGANLEKIDQSSKKRRQRALICGFCGAILKKGQTVCSGCGSAIR